MHGVGRCCQSRFSALLSWACNGITGQSYCWQPSGILPEVCCCEIMTCSCNIVDLDVDRWTDIVFFQEKCFFIFTTLKLTTVRLFRKYWWTVFEVNMLWLCITIIGTITLSSCYFSLIVYCVYRNVLEKHVLQSGSVALYTWQNPTGLRELVWSCGEAKDNRNPLDQVTWVLLFLSTPVILCKIYIIIHKMLQFCVHCGLECVLCTDLQS